MDVHNCYVALAEDCRQQQVESIPLARFRFRF
jgi:hypothetical protein